MSTELAPIYDGPDAMSTKIDYARHLSASNLLPDSFKGRPENVLWAIEYGSMLDLSPMVALTMVHIISGKPTASAGLISALVRRAGHKLRVSSSETEATAQIVRSDDPDYTFEVTWTIARATQAKLTGNANWAKYPASMLSARAITECARLACQEALLGMQHTPEEMGATVDEDGNVVHIATRVHPAAAAPAAQRRRPRTLVEAIATTAPAAATAVDLDTLLVQAENAPDKAMCQQLWREAGNLPDADAATVRAVLAARVEDLAAPAPGVLPEDRSDEILEGEVEA